MQKYELASFNVFGEQSTNWASSTATLSLMVSHGFGSGTFSWKLLFGRSKYSGPGTYLIHSLLIDI
jgi:hypothetical protein